MNIQGIQLEKPNQLKSESRDCSSSMKSQADQSKQTYTAIIFNDACKARPKENYSNERRQSTKSRQTNSRKEKNNDIQDLLTVNSLSKMISNHKDVRNSATLFVNVRLNSSIDKKTMKAAQRPVSAFTRANKQPIQLEADQVIKECYRENRDLSLSGKNCLDESAINIHQTEKERESTCNKLEPKIMESYGYIAKSRLLSNKQVKKISNQNSTEKIPKKSLQNESSVNFYSLYKNLLINNRTSKSNDKNGVLKSHQLHKKHKHSFHSSLKSKQNGGQKVEKQNSNTLIIISNERNSIYTLTDKSHMQISSINNNSKSYMFTNSFHKQNSKLSLTTSVLKSMKKGKKKISKILELKKEHVVQPKILIQNVQINKNMFGSSDKTPISLSYANSQKNITKYLTKLSYSMNKHRKPRESDQNCRLTVECKKVTYF